MDFRILVPIEVLSRKLQRQLTFVAWWDSLAIFSEAARTRKLVGNAASAASWNPDINRIRESSR